MLKQSKILFIDLDGTLLNSKGEITSYTKKIIKEAKEKGLYVILCSGRSNNDVIEKSKTVNASPIVISNNGALIFNYELNTKIYESKIELNTLVDIWNFAQCNNINVTYNSTYKRFKSINSKKNAIVVNNIEEIEDDATQIVVDTNDYDSIKQLKELIKNKYQDLEIINFWRQSTENSKEQFFEMDILNKFNSKGISIDKLLQFLNINKEYSICFGDQINDFSMFQSCGIKIAMKNGSEELKQKADLITSYTNNEDGVAKFIEKCIL